MKGIIHFSYSFKILLFLLCMFECGLYMCFYVHVHEYIQVNTHMCARVCKPEIGTDVFLNPTPILWDGYLNWTWGSPIWLSWLANGFKDPPISASQCWNYSHVLFRQMSEIQLKSPAYMASTLPAEPSARLSAIL